MADVTMSVEEYLRLIDAQPHVREALAEHLPKRTPKKRKRAGRKDPKMARALRKANSMGRKKSGGYKKGWSQGKIMKKAHQLRRRM